MKSCGCGGEVALAQVTTSSPTPPIPRQHFREVQFTLEARYQDNRWLHVRDWGEHEMYEALAWLRRVRIQKPENNYRLVREEKLIVVMDA